MQTLTIESLAQEVIEKALSDSDVTLFGSELVKEMIISALQSLLLEAKRQMPEGFNDLENTQSDHMRIGYQAGVNDCKQVLRNMRVV